jgi:hypothetical protein
MGVSIYLGGARSENGDHGTRMNIRIADGMLSFDGESVRYETAYLRPADMTDFSRNGFIAS